MKELGRIQYIKIADSFVKTNKTIYFRGNGEAKLYISQDKPETNMFFYSNKIRKIFINKSDLQTYLRDAKYEYFNQEMGYRIGDISQNYIKYLNEVNKQDDTIEIKLEATPILSKGRYYIRSGNEIWSFLRSILIPIISYFQIVKYVDEVDDHAEYIRFIPFIDYNYDRLKFNQEKKLNKKSNETDDIKKQKRDADEQKKYRDKLIDEFGFCILTTINIEALLVACHIKPHRFCDKKEEFDVNNGIILTPTFHKLFDSGFIAFYKSKLVFSSHILGQRQEKLIKKSIVRYNNFKFYERQKYIDWHYQNIFKSPS